MQDEYVSKSARMPKRTITASLYELIEQEFSQRLETTVQQKATVREGYLDESSEAIVNFANKRLGGGPFGSGLTMEENLVLKRFEYSLLIGMQMQKDADAKTERTLSMYPNEAIILSPAPQIFNYSMYGKVKPDEKEWKFQSDFTTSDGPLVISIDAYKNKKGELIYTKEELYAILKKAYVGFSGAKIEKPDLKVIETGKWGCGCFANNIDVIYVLQNLAANMAGVEIIFRGTQDEVSEGVKLIEDCEGKTVRECMEKLEKKKFATPP